MPDEYADCTVIAKGELERARSLLNSEIRSYPTPIAGCDAQFNHLLAERQRISAALSALRDDYFVPTPRSPNLLSGIESR